MKKSKTGRYFCSHPCAATYNNNLKASFLPVKICKLAGCGKRVKSWSIYCSLSCSASSRKRAIDSLKEEVLSKIRDFYVNNERIPIKKEMYDVYKKARTSFGSWNKAVAAAGFAPNPVMFANKYIAKDGHKCDSLAEKIVDEWFRSKGINHQRSVPYPEIPKMTCDFVVKDFYIEFFGLEGQHRKYDGLVLQKRKLSKKYGIKLIEIKPTDIFPKNKLDQVLNFLVN